MNEVVLKKKKKKTKLFTIWIFIKSPKQKDHVVHAVYSVEQGTGIENSATYRSKSV